MADNPKRIHLHFTTMRKGYGYVYEGSPIEAPEYIKYVREDLVANLVTAAQQLDIRCEEEDGYDLCLPWPERIALRAALKSFEDGKGEGK